MSEHARIDPPNHEGLPLLRPPMAAVAPSIEQDREAPAGVVYAAPLEMRKRRKDGRLSLVQSFRQRREDFAMIGATLALSVIAGIAVATALR